MPFEPSFFTRAPATPRLVLSLRRLAREIDHAWPDRATSSDGWIGDASHASRVSDHNPDRNGLVHALDVTAAGVNTPVLINRVTRHPATEYVIHDGMIWSRRFDMKPREYEGPDPHTSHVHVSVRHTRTAERNRTTWLR